MIYLLRPRREKLPVAARIPTTAATARTAPPPIMRPMVPRLLRPVTSGVGAGVIVGTIVGAGVGIGATVGVGVGVVVGVGVGVGLDVGTVVGIGVLAGVDVATV